MIKSHLSDEIEEWNFKAITEETSFYVSDKGNVVIGFDEGKVAQVQTFATLFLQGGLPFKKRRKPCII